MKSSVSGRPANRRLMHIIDTGGPGGAETVFMRLASGLQDRGWEAVTVISRDGWLADKLRSVGLKPIIVPPTMGKLAYLRKIRNIARQQQVSAIIGHLLGASFYASLAGFFARVPVVSVFHGQKDLETSRMNWLKGRALSAPKGCAVFVSESLRMELQPVLGLRDHRCTVINNGVDAKDFENASSTLRSQLSTDPETILVGAVGNIRTPKAYDILLRATAEICKRNPKIVILVAGEGRPPLSEELAALHTQLKLRDHFRFLGLVQNIPDFLAGLDIFVISSNKEGFSIACVEAMAAGLPVVATRSGGPESIVKNRLTGHLVAPGDPHALAEAVLELARDGEARKRMGTAGQIRAREHFSLESCIQAYCDVITRMSCSKVTD